MEKILEKLSQKIRETPKVDYLDIRIEEAKGVRFVIKKGEVEDISETDSLGYGVRALYKGRWGFASGNDIDRLEDKIKEASDFALSIGDTETKFEKVPIYKEEVISPMKIDPTEIPLEEKINPYLKYYKYIKNYDEKILDSSFMRYKDSKTIKHFLSSEGSSIKQEVKRAGFSVIVNAGKGDNIQTAHKSKATQKDYDIVKNIEEILKNTCKEALAMLDAKPVKAGTYTVICDQALGGLFVHEAFGHLSEADNIYKDEKMQKILKLDKIFGKKILNIYDDPTIDGAYGSYKYDEEGVKAKKSYLIKEGRLIGRLHSRETAAFTGELPTGNGRAINYNYIPIVRMANTCIEQGNSTFEDMISGIKEGIYAKGLLGGQTSHESFVFSAQYGYMIRNGEIKEMVRDIKLSGNVFKTLQDIDMIGNDFEIESSLGGCGKDGKSPLPVTHGSPHIRIQNIVVGGE